jgi:hypothetical protein
MAQEDEEIRIDDTPVISVRADELSGRFARLTGRQMVCESSSRLGLALAKLVGSMR